MKEITKERYELVQNINLTRDAYQFCLNKFHIKERNYLTYGGGRERVRYMIPAELKAYKESIKTCQRELAKYDKNNRI